MGLDSLETNPNNLQMCDLVLVQDENQVEEVMHLLKPLGFILLVATNLSSWNNNNPKSAKFVAHKFSKEGHVFLYRKVSQIVFLFTEEFMSHLFLQMLMFSGAR